MGTRVSNWLERSSASGHATSWCGAQPVARQARLAKEKLPNDPGVMDTVGWVYYKKGLFDSAIVEFADSLDKIPENVMVRYHLGMTYIKKGMMDKAKMELEKVLAADAEFEKAEEIRKLLLEL